MTYYYVGTCGIVVGKCYEKYMEIMCGVSEGIVVMFDKREKKKM